MEATKKTKTEEVVQDEENYEVKTDYSVPPLKRSHKQSVKYLKKYLRKDIKERNPEFDWEYLQSQLKEFKYSVEKFGPIILRKVHGTNRFLKGEFVVKALLEIQSTEIVPYKWAPSIYKTRHGRRKKTYNTKASN